MAARERCGITRNYRGIAGDYGAEPAAAQRRSRGRGGFGRSRFGGAAAVAGGAEEKAGADAARFALQSQIRGRAAEADEKFVAKLAEKYQAAVSRGLSGREVAWRSATKPTWRMPRGGRAMLFFAQATGEHELDKIAVAHTADDQAETVLAHILRGSGLTGLGGIHPQVGKVVRPLLGARRAELRAFLKSRKQSWREDATNRDVAKLRARIRKKLLPLLQKEFQPRVVEHLTALARARARRRRAAEPAGGRAAEKQTGNCGRGRADAHRRLAGQ